MNPSIRPFIHLPIHRFILSLTHSLAHSFLRSFMLSFVMQAGIARAEELLPNGLDYLIANAGVVGSFERASKVSKESLVTVMNTNFISVVCLIQLCLPLLRKGNKKMVPHFPFRAVPLENRTHCFLYLPFICLSRERRAWLPLSVLTSFSQGLCSGKI